MHKLSHILRLGWAYKFSRDCTLGYPPYQFTIEPTNICNLKCTFCPQSDPEHAAKRPRGALSIPDFSLFLRRVAEVRPGNRNLNLTLDGEPFCNRYFLQFIEMAISAGYFPIFAANATLLDHESAERLIAAGPFRVSIDFASNREIFGSIRGLSGHFNLVHDNLLYLMEQSRHIPGIHLDVHDIAPFTGVEPRESLAKMRSMFPAKLPGHIRFFSRKFHNFCGHLALEGRGDSYRRCPYPWTQLAVTYSGDCVACCRDTSGRTVLGNVFEQPLMSVWNGPKYREFRQNLIHRRPDLNAACAACDLPYSSDSRWKIPYMLRSLLGR